MPLKYLKAPAEDEDSLCRVFSSVCWQRWPTGERSSPQPKKKKLEEDIQLSDSNQL